MKNLFRTSNYEKYYKGLVPYLKKEKNQKYLSIILTLSASIFFILFAVNPTISTIVKLKKQIADAETVQSKLSQKIINLTSLSQQYQELQPDLPLILDAVPENPKAPTLVGQIQTIGSNSSITSIDIDIDTINLNGGTSTQSSSFSFSVTGQGDFENIQSFVKSLTTMERVLSITSIQFSKATEGNALNFVIKGFAYFKK